MIRTLMGALLLTLAASAAAEIELGIAYGVPGDRRIEAEPELQLRVGAEHGYIWGSAMGLAEKSTLSLRGQNLAKAEIYGAGIGLRHSWDRWRVFLEFGKFWTKEHTTAIAVRAEAVVADLTHDHGDIPFQPEHTTYELGNAYGGRLGGSYQLPWWDRAVVGIAYRALHVSEDINACTGPDPSCKFPVQGQHYQNLKNRALRQIEFSASLRF